MVRPDPTALVREGYARFQASDYELLLDFFLSCSAPDVELHSRLGSFYGEPYRGHDGIRTWLADIQENFARFTPWHDELRAFGTERVLVLGGISFRARESGVDMSECAGWIYEFEQGLLCQVLFFGTPEEAVEEAERRRRVAGPHHQPR